VVGILWRQPVLEMFMASVALAVGMIPEGLPGAARYGSFGYEGIPRAGFCGWPI
jgi:hypothetical protein